jgi:Fe-S-cluster containining protein
MDCKGCGKCCDITNDPYLDVELFEEDRVPIYGLEFRSSSGQFYLKRNLDGTCIFLNENKECAIYNDRPRECREFTQEHSVCKRLTGNDS